MKLNDLRYLIENVGFSLVEDNHTPPLQWPDNVTWPWQQFPDLFDPPAGGWPPVDGVPSGPVYIPDPPGWWGGSPNEWRDYYRRITNPPYTDGPGIPWDGNDTNTNYPYQFEPRTPELTPDNPLGIRPDTPDNPMTPGEWWDPAGGANDGVLDAPDDPDTPGQGGTPFDGPYGQRGWHWRDGEFVWDPHSPGGYSNRELEWFNQYPDTRIPPNPNRQPGWDPRMQPNVPTGPGFYPTGPGGMWVPYIEMPPGHFTPDFNGDGIPDGPPMIRPVPAADRWNPGQNPGNNPYRPDTNRPGGAKRPKRGGRRSEFELEAPE